MRAALWRALWVALIGGAAVGVVLLCVWFGVRSAWGWWR